MSEVININGTKYTEEDFNQEQSYFIKQIRSLKAQIANKKFELFDLTNLQRGKTNTTSYLIFFNFRRTSLLTINFLLLSVL